jgi:hypothetical protein
MRNDKFKLLFLIVGLPPLHYRAPRKPSCHYYPIYRLQGFLRVSGYQCFFEDGSAREYDVIIFCTGFR